MKPVRLITLSGDASREPEVAAAVSAEASLELVLRCVDRVEALAAIRGASIHLILAVGPVGWFDHQCLQEARAQGVRVMGMAADPVEVELLEVAGIEVLPADTGVPGLAEAMMLTEPNEPTPTATGPAGKVIAVWGPKGAPGRTSVAIEVAMTLALSESRTLLADADLYGGDVAQLLGIVEELMGIVPLARKAAKGELSLPTWPELLRRVGPPGPVVLPGTIRAELWREVSGFGWDALLEASRRTFRFSVVDVGFCLEAGSFDGGADGRNGVARTTVAAADQVVAVVRPDPIGMKAFLWALSDHDDLELRDRALVVLNRARRGDCREARALLRRHLGRPPVAEIPERADLFARAIWQGDPVSRIDPQSDVSDAVRDLAAALGGTVPPRGFLTRLAGRTHV